jgi:hypothetical protein
VDAALLQRAGLGGIGGDHKTNQMNTSPFSLRIFVAYIATNFLGHGTVNPKANESDD